MSKSPSLWQRIKTSMVLLVMIAGLLVFVVGGAYVLSLDRTVRERFEGNRWAIPAKVYARPLVLQSDTALSQALVIEELKSLHYRRITDAPNPGSYDVRNNILFVHTRGFRFASGAEAPQLVRLRFEGQRLVELASTQPRKDGQVRLEPMVIGGIYPSHNEDRILMQLKEAPPYLIESLMATEDQRFYKHMGISLRGILRAAFVNTTSGAVVQGGSTLTQQLVKNFFLTDERSLKRKLNEAVMALLLEWHYDKNDILEAYLNEVNLGQQGNLSVNGFGLASQFYFGQPIGELSLPQVALLVGMVKGPSFYNPRRQPERALARRNVVLDSLYREGVISLPARDAAMKAELGVLANPQVVGNRYPDFLDLVRRQLREIYQAQDLTDQGLQIFTTLDPRVQKAAEDALTSAVTRLRQQGRSELQGAVLAADVQSGDLLGLVGGATVFTGYNRAIDARRQVGSLLKPAIYLAAVSSGRYTLGSPIDDAPVEVVSDSGKTWRPQNYDNQSHGVVTLKDALAYSYNQAAVRLGMSVGLPMVIASLRQLGVTTDLTPYPSLLLGAADMRPMDVLQLYQTMLSMGTYAPILSIREVVSADGQVLKDFRQERRQVIDPADGYQLHWAMQQVMNEGTGRSANARLPSQVLAGKTGTTNDMRDSWFAGAAGNHLAVVWLGRDDNKPIGLSGGAGALPIWTDMMVRIQPPVVRPRQPTAITWDWVDSSSGKLSKEDCSNVIYVPLSAKNRPAEMTSCAVGGLPGLFDSFIDGVRGLFGR
ncbi:MAG: penicillin-binding protein 1B [Moraxellaceae bacterium]|nr:penicillin-binding protein 1B [Moraxellaceae bacterium]MDZ4387464.1 penicillin-binding protein 1B [Moraxellaceae bacterium]